MALLAVIFAGAALVLVGVGLYGVLAHLVAQKALEISLRKALGATSGRIVREVTTPAFLILLLGGVSGLAVACTALPRVMDAALYQVTPRDWMVYALAAFILVAATAPALVGPAARGSAQDPGGALRMGLG